jgi:Ulp1 family protease
MFGIKYADFWAYREGKYTGCEAINSYMHLLEETYNNGGKSKFFAHQFFDSVLEDETTLERVVKKRDFKKGWAKWEKLFFPIQHNDHWFFIVADKVKEEILIYDSLAHDNKHHFYVILKLIHRMKTKKENWIVDTQQLKDHEVFQQQHDGVNYGYFTC